MFIVLKIRCVGFWWICRRKGISIYKHALLCVLIPENRNCFGSISSVLLCEVVSEWTALFCSKLSLQTSFTHTFMHFSITALCNTHTH